MTEQLQSDREEGASLPDWCSVYQGMSEDEIAEVEAAILARDKRSRPLRE